jgi:hypothetical protein
MDAQKFKYFDNLSLELKGVVCSHLDSPRDILRLLAINKGVLPAEHKARMLDELRQESMSTLTNIVRLFWDECRGFQEKFTTNREIRLKHYKMFFDGYPQNGILQNQQTFQEYNFEFMAMISEFLDLTNTGIVPVSERTSDYIHVFNMLRFQDQHKEIAMNALFTFHVDELYDNKLVIDFESDVVLDLYVNICLDEDLTQCEEVSFTWRNLKTKKKCKGFYTLREKDDDTNEWILHEPYGWIESFVTATKLFLGEHHVLGRITNIKYLSCSLQAWRKAYFDYDFIPSIFNLA